MYLNFELEREQEMTITFSAFFPLIGFSISQTFATSLTSRSYTAGIMCFITGTLMINWVNG